MTSSIGQRMTHIRASISQRQFAEALGVPLRTYQNYEQDKREPDLRTLAGLHSHGWNLNWVLTGEGPERLEALQDKESGGESAQSQNLNQQRLTLALQLVEDALASKNAYLPTAKRAEAAMLVYELLGSGLPEAEVIPFARRAVGLAEGGAVDGNRGTVAVGR